MQHAQHAYNCWCKCQPTCAPGQTLVSGDGSAFRSGTALNAEDEGTCVDTDTAPSTPASQSQIITSLPSFQTGAKKSKTRLESRIKRFNPTVPYPLCVNDFSGGCSLHEACRRRLLARRVFVYWASNVSLLPWLSDVITCDCDGYIFPKCVVMRGVVCMGSRVPDTKMQT